MLNQKRKTALLDFSRINKANTGKDIVDICETNNNTSHIITTKKTLSRTIKRKKRAIAKKPIRDDDGQITKNEHNLRLGIKLLFKGFSLSIMEYFYSFYRNGKICFAARETIAKEIGCHPRHVPYLTSSLSQKNYIKKVNRGPSHQTNLYAINAEAILAEVDRCYPVTSHPQCTNFAPLDSQKCTNFAPHQETILPRNIYINPLLPPQVESSSHNLIAQAEGSNNMFKFKSLEENMREAGINGNFPVEPTESPVKSILAPREYKDTTPAPKHDLNDIRNVHRATCGQALKILGKSYTPAEEERFYRQAFKEMVNPIDLVETAQLIQNDFTLKSQTKNIFRLFSRDEIYTMAKSRPKGFYLQVKNRGLAFALACVNAKPTKKEIKEYLERGEKLCENDGIDPRDFLPDHNQVQQKNIPLKPQNYSDRTSTREVPDGGRVGVGRQEKDPALRFGESSAL